MCVFLCLGPTAAEPSTVDSSPSQQLHSALTRHLSGRLEPPLGLHVATTLLSLARLPALHVPALIPPLLLPQTTHHSLSEQALDQGLLEGEVWPPLTALQTFQCTLLLQVLQQYMARSNSVGWLSRPQFEERWMQLLAVVNQPPPPEVRVHGDCES